MRYRLNPLRVSSFLRDAYGSPCCSPGQLAFMHPTLFKAEHPRFCYERLEYIGQKIQVSTGPWSQGAHNRSHKEQERVTCDCLCLL